MTDADRIAQLERIVEELQRKLAEATRTVEQLTEENGRLRKVEEAWRRGLRERSKRRSSKAAGGAFIGPKRKRGRPGGVVGSNRPVPPEVDHVKCHDMPATCTCGGAVEATGETKSTIVEDIPPVKVERTRHDAPVGQCTKCRKKVHARLPGMTADGTTAAHTQLGPGAISLVESLRMDLRASMRGIEKFVDEWFKLSLSSGGVSQLLEREAVRSRPAVDEISAHIEKAKLAGADETGMSEDGKLAWVWLVQTPEASLFRVERSRAACVVDEMLGGFTGVLTSDFYAAYTRPNLPWKQAFCGGHLVRDAKKFAELGPSTATITFSERLSSLYHYGQLAVSTGDDGVRDAVVVGFHDLAHDDALGTDADVARLQARISKRFVGITAFLYDPKIPATNNWSEREIRFVASYRKMTGGTRSEAGSETFATHMSITRTLRKSDLALRGWNEQRFWTHVEGRPPPSVFRAPTPDA